MLRSLLFLCCVGLIGWQASLSVAQETATEPAVVDADSKAVYVLLQTSKGDITLELDAEKAPVTVENFVTYVKEGYFKDTVFHRVISGFMIQGGGYPKDDLNNTKETHEPIKNEGGNGLLNEPYTIAMARTNDPDSATSQFFINHGKNDFLNRSKSSPGYAVFGKVISGQEVVDEIADGAVTVKNGERSFPLVPVVITDCKIVDKPQ